MSVNLNIMINQRMAQAMFLKVAAEETQMLNKKMPVDIIKDENPDWFPKCKKVAKAMQEDGQPDIFSFLIDSCQEEARTEIKSKGDGIPILMDQMKGRKEKARK